MVLLIRSDKDQNCPLKKIAGTWQTIQRLTQSGDKQKSEVLSEVNTQATFLKQKLHETEALLSRYMNYFSCCLLQLDSFWFYRDHRSEKVCAELRNSSEQLKLKASEKEREVQRLVEECKQFEQDKNKVCELQLIFVRFTYLTLKFLYMSRFKRNCLLKGRKIQKQMIESKHF